MEMKKIIVIGLILIALGIIAVIGTQDFWFHIERFPR